MTGSPCPLASLDISPRGTLRARGGMTYSTAHAENSSRDLVVLFALETSNAATGLPFSTVFKGQDQFNRLVSLAKANNWKSLPIGERTAAVGRALVGTRYRSYTLEIDDHVEAASANFNGMDCWTFFEISLAFARMLNEPAEEWTPAKFLHYIELDRYRDGECTGDYLSRLHYLEDWLYDNDRRGLVADLTRELGGIGVSHSAREMSAGWRQYRYLKADRRLLGPIANMEARVNSRPLIMIPKSRVAGIDRVCAMAISSELFRAIAVACIPQRTSASLCARAMVCISCIILAA